jgi:hypothetical protein
MKWSALGKKEAESLQHGFEKGSLTKPAGRIEADPLFALDADGRKKRDTSSTEPVSAHSSNCMTMGDSLTKPTGRIEAYSLFALDADGQKKKGHVLDGASVSAFIRLHY